MRVVKEKSNHFDLLLLKDNDRSHYAYISNFSRFAPAQKNLHKERKVLHFVKGVFQLDSRQKNKLEEHSRICGEYKSILPVIPAPGTILEFDGWNKTQRHPIVIYADFEALLVKCE